MSGVEPVASPKSIIPRVSNPGDIFGKPGGSDVEQRPRPSKDYDKIGRPHDGSAFNSITGLLDKFHQPPIAYVIVLTPFRVVTATPMCSVRSQHPEALCGTAFLRRVRWAHCLAGADENGAVGPENAGPPSFKFHPDPCVSYLRSQR